MKKSRFTKSQILAILTESGSGIPVPELCRKHGISSPTYYQWKSKYARMSLPELKRVKELEAGNAKLKRMHAGLTLENAVMMDVLSRATLYREPADRIERDAPEEKASDLPASVNRWLHRQSLTRHRH